MAGIIERVTHDGDKHAGENEVFSKEPAIIETYRKRTLVCAHCKTNRYRVKTIICREVATGDLMQLGMECAINYIGDAQAQVDALEFQQFILNLLSAFGDEDASEGKGGWSGHAIRAFDSEDVVAQTVCVIRKTGSYIPSRHPSRYDDEPGEPNMAATWREVDRRLNESRIEWKVDEADVKRLADLHQALADPKLTCSDRELTDRLHTTVLERLATAQRNEKIWQENQPTEADRTYAKTVLEWVMALQPKEDDKFMIDLKSVFSPGWVSSKKLGFAACVTRAYERAQQAAKDLANPPTAPAPEGRVEVEGTVLTLKLYTNEMYDTSTWKMLVRLTTGAKVFCSVPRDAHAKIGDVLKFVATFKRSDTDQFFAYGTCPKLPSPQKVKKPKKAAAIAVAQPELAVA